MSYDFFLTLPKIPENSGNTGKQATIDRVARAVAILRQHEPDIEIEPHSNGVTALSEHFGDVDITPEEIRLSLSMSSGARVVYGKLHRLMAQFSGEGYQGDDPQLSRGTVDHYPDFVEFMAQYREHFECSDAEFAQWCRAADQSDASQELGRAEYERRASQLPRGVPLPHAEQRALSPEALWNHLQEIVAQNDAAIAALGLQPYFDMLAAELKARHPCYRPPRSFPGRWYESLFFAPWFQGSLLHYETQTLNLLYYRNHPAAMAICPQRYTLATPTPDGSTPDDWKTLINSITPRLRDQGLLHRPPQALVIGLSPSVTFDGDDVDAIHRVAWPIVVTSARYIEATLRRGIEGAPENVVVHAGKAGG
ncbi:MAG: hypothetical protein JNN30_19145 [Rhodanobacteraceae bacterium]|nr:hypothetical protein [Rhodanobacteraceae bacterium]